MATNFPRWRIAPVVLGVLLVTGTTVNAQQARIVLSVDSELVTFADLRVNIETIELTVTADPPFASDTTVAVTCRVDHDHQQDVVIPAMQTRVVVPDFACLILTPANCFTPTYVATFSGVVEADESIQVQSAQMTIRDDPQEEPIYQLSVEPTAISESSGERGFTVTAEKVGGEKPCETETIASIVAEVDDTPQPGAVDFSVSNRRLTFEVDDAGSFSVTPENDDEDERDRWVTVSGQAEFRHGHVEWAYQLVDARPTQFVIEDDDPDVPRVSVADALAAEGAGSLAFVATLEPAGSTQVTVDYATADGTARAGSDYRSARGTLTFAPGTTAETVAVVVVDDDIHESPEYLAFTLTNPENAALLRPSARGVIRDDDDAPTGVSLSATPPRVHEGAGETSVSVTATLDGRARSRTTVVTVSVTGSGTPEAVDFEPVSDFPITIEAGTTCGAGSFTVAPVDDAVVEADEILTVSGTSDLPVTSATVVLEDDDVPPGRILLSAEPTRVSEGDGPTAVAVTAALDRGLRQSPTTVVIEVAGSDDPDAADFEAVPDFTMVIPGNAASATATFTLTPLDDEVVETAEVVTIAGRSDLPVTTATVVLEDDDEASIILSAAPALVSEGDGATVVTVTANLAGARLQVPMSVTVSVSGRGGHDAVDFVPVPDVAIVIPAAEASGNGAFTLVPINDDVVEADETVEVSGTSPLAVRSTTVTLADDDVSVLYISDAAGDEGGRSLDFVVTLAPPARADVTVAYATADRTAHAGIDYEARAGTLTFAWGESKKTIRIAVVDDAFDEADTETFAVGLSDPSGAALARPSATGSIRDNDEPPAITVGDAAGAEDVGELAFVVTLDPPGQGGVTVVYATVPGTASAGSDYEAAAGVLTFAAGESAGTIRVAVLDDALDEADEETFAVELSSPAGATLARAQATGTIADDDAPPEVSIEDAVDDEAVGELAFAVALDRPSGLEVTVEYATADGTATADADYRSASGSLRFPAGTVSRTIHVVVLDDAVHEPEETFVVVLAEPNRATLADADGTGTIRDDDLAPPSTSGGLPTVMLCVGGAPFAVDLGKHFAGEGLRYTAVSSTAGIVQATLEDGRLTVSPVAEGEAVVSVTATNDAGSVGAALVVTVITDPAELRAVDAVLASVARNILANVADAVAERFAGPASPGVPSAVRHRPPAPALPGSERPAGHVPGTNMATEPYPVARGSFFGTLAAGATRPTSTPLPRHRPFAPFAFSVDASPPSPTAARRSWSLWGRSDVRRFESDADDTSRDGDLTGVHLGMDMRTGPWQVGVSLLHSEAEVEYRFTRSTRGCGGGLGEGLLEARVASVHPYAGRRVGRGSVWATLGAGRGDAAAEQCESGRVSSTDVSVRLAALGGRHPFATAGRIAVSVVEDAAVLTLSTAASDGPVGDRSATVSHVRLGLEASTVAASASPTPTVFVRAQGRNDWGDGATGTGLELAAGVRHRHPLRRLGVDAGVRVLALHSAHGVRERSVNATLSILPKPDGTGIQGSLTWRRGHPAPRVRGTRWAWHATPDADDWHAAARLAYGLHSGRGVAMPYLELGTGSPVSGRARIGVRHRIGDSSRRLAVDWQVDRGGDDSGLRLVVGLVGWF